MSFLSERGPRRDLDPKTAARRLGLTLLAAITVGTVTSAAIETTGSRDGSTPPVPISEPGDDIRSTYALSPWSVTQGFQTITQDPLFYPGVAVLDKQGELSGYEVDLNEPITEAALRKAGFDPSVFTAQRFSNGPHYDLSVNNGLSYAPQVSTGEWLVLGRVNDGRRVRALVLPAAFATPKKDLPATAPKAMPTPPVRINLTG